jgi:hypothetical protein
MELSFVRALDEETSNVMTSSGVRNSSMAADSLQVSSTTSQVMESSVP